MLRMPLPHRNFALYIGDPLGDLNAGNSKGRRRLFKMIDGYGEDDGGAKGFRTGRCQGCDHLEHVRIERLLAGGASIKETVRKLEIDHHALRRHWINHVSAEARATYIAGAGIVRGAPYKGFGGASEVGDGNSLALLARRLHENFRDCGQLTGELQRGPLNIQTTV